MITGFADYIGELFIPFGGISEQDDVMNSFYYLDNANESEFRKVIREVILSNFKLKINNSQIEIKKHLGWALASNDYDFNNAYNSYMFPFDPPMNDCRLIFQWTWEELFPGESYDKYKLLKKGVDVFVPEQIEV